VIRSCPSVESHESTTLPYVFFASAMVAVAKPMLFIGEKPDSKIQSKLQKKAVWLTASQRTDIGGALYGRAGVFRF
jgi:hypothetical protein